MDNNTNEKITQDNVEMTIGNNENTAKDENIVLEENNIEDGEKENDTTDSISSSHVDIDTDNVTKQETQHRTTVTAMETFLGLASFREKIEANTKLKRLFQIDALKEPVFDPTSHSNNTIGYTILFYISVLIYTIYASINFMNRPEQTTFSLLETKELPLQHLRMDIKCTTPWGCFKNASNPGNGWVWDASPWISATYDDKNDMERINIGGKFTTKNITDIPLQFSQSPDHGILIKVPDYKQSDSSDCSTIYGSSCSPMLKVKILANEPSCSGPMQINMDLEPHQRKAVYIGVIVRKNDDPSVKTTYELFNKDLFYVGKNSAKTATLEIKMAQFAQVFHTHRPGTIPDLFGDVGGKLKIHI